MKSFLTFLFMILAAALYSQKLEAYAGLNLNTFHDYNNNGGNYAASFNSGLGPVVGIGIDSVRLDLLKFRFTLQYDRVAGELDAYEQGHWYSHNTEAEIKKSTLSLGIFPLSFRIIILSTMALQTSLLIFLKRQNR